MASKLSQHMPRKKADEGDIDMTSMLDVVFILLIFFIVTASFVKEKALDVDVPDPDLNPPPVNPDDPKNFLVKITNNDEIWIDNRRVDVRSIRANIERLKAENPAGSVIIQAQAKSTLKAVVSVMDAARQAGVTAISMAAAAEE